MLYLKMHRRPLKHLGRKMNPILKAIITRFRGAQDQAVSKLLDELKITAPTSNINWVTSCDRKNLSALGEIHGIVIKPHGYGVEMVFPNVTIDFNWGDYGEGYGFDLWRIWNYCLENDLYLESVTYEILKLWFDEAQSLGELVCDQHLFYLQSERASKRPNEAASAIDHLPLIQ